MKRNRLVSFNAIVSIWVDESESEAEAIDLARVDLSRVDHDVCISEEAPRSFYVAPDLEGGWIDVED